MTSLSPTSVFSTLYPRAQGLSLSLCAQRIRRHIIRRLAYINDRNWDLLCLSSRRGYSLCVCSQRAPWFTTGVVVVVGSPRVRAPLIERVLVYTALFSVLPSVRIGCVYMYRGTVWYACMCVDLRRDRGDFFFFPLFGGKLSASWRSCRGA